MSDLQQITPAPAPATASAAGSVMSTSRGGIAAAFARARAEGRPAIIPYMTAGFPTLETSEETILGLVKGGADIVEIGIPFSDPMADGATIQRSSQVALNNGVGMSDCFALVRRLRDRGVTIPLVFMGYYNPILRMGPAEFAEECFFFGVDGVIVPDLPAGESDELVNPLREFGRDFIFMVAPTSTEERLRAAVERASGFVYCVSLTGVTGGRSALPDLGPYLQRVRALTDLPLAVGFGISTPDHVRQVAEFADGAIIGSALIALLERLPADEQPAAAEAFARRMVDGARALPTRS